MTSLQNGEFPEAERLSREALARGDNELVARLILALSLHSQGKVEEALPEFVALTIAQPNVYEYWNNLGNALRELKRHDEAAAAYRRAQQISPRNAGVLFNLGLNHFDLGEMPQALHWLQQAHALEPDDLEIRVYYASSAFECAELSLARDLSSAFGSAEGLGVKGLGEAAWLLYRVGSPEQGEQLIEAAVARYPDSALLKLRQASLYERSNRLEEARTIIAALDADRSRLDPALIEDLQTQQATLAGRDSNPAQARALTEALVGQLTNPVVLASLYFSLARLRDRDNDAAGAVDALEKAHAHQIDVVRRKAPSVFEPGNPALPLAHAPLSAAKFADWPALRAPSTAQSPVFIVGFPRSGTTMLETMLDAHPALVCMDERPFLQDPLDVMSSLGLAYPEDLGRLDDAQCDLIRARYWKLVGECVSLAPGQRLVDKNPLNLLKLPLIKRLWPEAHVILALRHPCDVVLSNYMQNFFSPSFVAMCRSIESTAQAYADALSFWQSQQALLGANVLEMRYEDLVADLPTQARRVLDFLGLPWDEGVVQFHEHARKRGFISTPSYSQVIQPVYSRSVERWRAYAPWFAAALPHLAPHAARYGYTVE